jgi:DNA-binding CsgD family transcriptional regulator
MGLSSTQAGLYARFAQAAITVSSEDDFKRLVADHVAPLFPHQMLLAVVGQLTFEQLSIRHRIGIGYEPWMLEAIPEHINIRERPVIQRWLEDRAPKVIDLPHARSWISVREIAEIEGFQLGRIAVHGVPDISAQMATYFSFARVPEALDASDLSDVLTLICPLMHGALLKVYSHEDRQQGNATLTHIEKELLMWIAAGRTNAEIAALRQRSASTIKNQLEQLYKKLGASNRAEATAIAHRQRAFAR